MKRHWVRITSIGFTTAPIEAERYSDTTCRYQHNELRLLWVDVSHRAKLNVWHYSRNTTSLPSPSYRLLESVLRRWWDWSWRFECLPIPFNRYDTPSLLFGGGNIWGVGASSVYI